MKIKIAIADDHKLFREGIVALLKDNHEMVVKYQASDGMELFEKFGLKKTPVDVLLLDLGMQNMDGIEVLRRLKATRPDVKTLVLSMHNEDALLQELVELGAKGFIHKNSDFEKMQDAIYKIYNGDLYFSEDVYKRLIKRMAKRETYLTIKNDTNLTEKELMIVRLLGKEYSTKEIAKQLFISERTVETHKRNIYLKTGTKNIAGILVHAMRKGIIE